jgi:hypothetical protein
MYGISYIPSYKTQRVAASVKQAATLVYFYSIFSNITRLYVLVRAIV